MNERIKELSEQALNIVSNKRILKDGQLERTWDPDAYDKAFAGLIVQDCLFMIRVKASHYIDPEWRDGLINDINQHFGVQSHIKQMEE